MFLKDLVDMVGKEKRNKARVKTAQKFAVGMGIAGAVGALVGILFAPKTGKETMAEIKKKTVKTVEDIEDAVKNTVEKVKKSASHAVKSEINEMKDDAGESMKDMRETDISKSK